MLHSFFGYFYFLFAHIINHSVCQTGQKQQHDDSPPPPTLKECRLGIDVDRLHIVHPHAVAVGAPDIEPVLAGGEISERGVVAATTDVSPSAVVETVGIAYSAVLGVVESREIHSQRTFVHRHFEPSDVQERMHSLVVVIVYRRKQD